MPYSALAWYAVMVKPRFEKVVAERLRFKGYEVYLPLLAERRGWSDRSKIVEFPLFPRYVFCRFHFNNRLPILSTPGVFKIVGFGANPSPVPDTEIESLRTLLRSGVAARSCDYLATGQKVRVLSGPLAGLDAMFVEEKSVARVVVSVHLLQRSVTAEVDREWLRPEEPLPFLDRYLSPPRFCLSP